VPDPLPHPSFVIIGAQKSATRWLRLNLGQHPDIFTAPTEVGFFNSKERFREGPEWYAAQFEGWSGEPIVGEATPAYMMYRRREPTRPARRIQRFDREMRLIAVLRNPVDRAYSAFVHHMKKERIPPDTGLLEYVRGVRPHDDPLNLISGGWYFASLRPFEKRFKSRLLVILHDDVKTDPVGVYESALRHVGAESSFLPPELGEVRYNNNPPKASGLQDGTGGYMPLTDDQRGELYGYFRDDVHKLQSMLHRDLSHWLPGRRGPDSADRDVGDSSTAR
jgi:hypothetical protein